MPSAHDLLQGFRFTGTGAICQPQAQGKVPFSVFSWSSSDEYSEGNAAITTCRMTRRLRLVAQADRRRRSCWRDRSL